MGEEWRPIPEFPGYEAGSLGHIRSWLPCNRNARTPSVPRDRRQFHNDKVGGYHYVTLRRDGRTVTRRVHVLVAAAFLGPRPEGKEVMHLNHIKCDNAVTNLEYGTHAENMSFNTKEARLARR